MTKCTPQQAKCMAVSNYYIFSFFLLINSLTYGGQYATACLHNTLTSTVTNGHCTKIIDEFVIIVPTTDTKTTEIIVYTTS